ncbi:hypothetical protein VTI74DRAFT_9022 [Chaetomium olivicolor]
MHLPSLLNLTALTPGNPSPSSLPTVRSTLGSINFPDPSITYDPQTSSWYAFASQGNSHHIQAATSSHSPYGPWRYLNATDLLPHPGPWTNASFPATWAPDVQYLPATDSFVLYYAAALPQPHGRYKCIGAATAPNITGPYEPSETPIVCPVRDGGAIDASGFRDEADGSRWILYKVDGSALGPGGKCGNGEPPGEPTPLMLQRVDERDGVTRVGEPRVLMDRDPEVDGPLVEAPSLVRLREVPDGAEWRYVLFYSSHCYNEEEYDVRYAVAEGIEGPWKRMGQLMGKQKGSFGGVKAPGGATGVPGGRGFVFHADCEAGRCMFDARFVVKDGRIKITG